MPDREILAIIPARGGSQRLPGKNLVDFHGKPLLAWTIEAAESARHVTRTVVSTDDPEIAGCAQKFGADVIDRPIEISGPTASSESALIHVIETLKEQEDYRSDLIVFLQATSPLRGDDDVDRAIETLDQQEADSLFSAGPVPGFAWIVSDGRPAPVNYDPQNRPRTQDLTERVVAENGSIYVFKTEILETQKCRLGGRIAVFEQEPVHAFEIDDQDDLDWIEKLMAIRG